MLRLLSERENGILCPLALRRAQNARRYFNLELSKNTEVQETHKGAVNSVDLDVAENRYLLSGGSDSTIAIHDTQSSVESVQQRGAHGGQVTYPQVCQVSASSGGGSRAHSVETVQWYPVDTGLFTSSGADCSLKVWDTNHLQVADSFKFSGLVHTHHMSPVARKHTLVAVGAGKSEVKLVDIRSGSASHQLKGHDSPVHAVRWSSRHEFLLATGGVDKRVILWDVRKAKGGLVKLDQHRGRHKSDKTTTAHDGTINTIHFTPDGLHLVTFGTDHRVRVWETSAGDLLPVNFGVVSNTVKKSLQMEVVAECSPPVLFLPSDSAICVFDLFRGEHLDTLSGHYNFVNCCVGHPETQYLFSGGSDRNLLVWTPVCEDDQEDEDGGGHTSAGKQEEGSRTRNTTTKTTTSSKTTTNTTTTSTTALTADTWSSDDDDDT